MTVTVSVYQKDFLCRGPPIGNARFEAVRSPGLIWYPDMPLNFSQGGPLSGSTHVYTVELPIYQNMIFTEFYLRVSSSSHNPDDVFVRDWETHEVWLTRQ
jgi:hypothetical protein